MALTKTEKKHIGSFDDRLTFENQNVTGGDGMGGSTTEWQNEVTLWANVKPVSAKEKLHLEAVDSSITHIIQTRYSQKDLSNQSRISWGNRTLNVKYKITEGEDKAFHEYTAIEEV